jgi:hypothetical protein
VPDIVAKLHVEVAVKDGSASFAVLMLFGRHWGGILENVEGRLAEYPRLRIVTRHHSHTDTQVTVAAEDVHGAAEPWSLRLGDANTDQQRER